MVRVVLNGKSSAISVGTDFMGGIGKVGKMGKGFGGGRAPSNGGGVTGGAFGRGFVNDQMTIL